MANTLEILIAADSGSVSVTRALVPDPKLALEARCLWVCPDVFVADNGRIGAKVLLHGTQAAVLDRGASLDDAGDRGGPILSVDSLKASHASVHAARGAFRH